jgi:hypothetical protein|tara:strand:- start:6565 stop:6918 length:354 start_codon:yes stop_codon:yes gene_type:complete
MPKIISINNKDLLEETCYMGCLDADYNLLVEKIGSPIKSLDGYKTDAEWVIEFDGGCIATIYNWKDGKNYRGDEGLDPKDISEWHVGGNDKCVTSWIYDLIHNSWPAFDDIRQEAQF